MTRTCNTCGLPATEFPCGHPCRQDVAAPGVDPRDLWFAEWQLTLPKDAREAWSGGQRAAGVNGPDGGQQ